MGWFRSKEMKYISITCHQSLVEKVVRILGNVSGNTGVFQFLDSNQSLTAVQRSAKHTLFAHALTQIRRCDDMERIIRYLSSEMRRIDESLSKTLTDPMDADQETYLNEHVDAVLEDETGAAFENLYVETQQLEARLRQLVANMTDLTQQHNRAVQRRQVLFAGRAFYAEGGVAEAKENIAGGKGKTNGRHPGL